MDPNIKADLFRYDGKTGWRGFMGAFFIPGFRYTFFLRKSATTKKYSIPGIIYRMLLQRYSFKYGFQIFPHTQIGKGFYLGHFGTVIINGKAVIGKYCNIASGVTIGQTNRGRLAGCPTIGDQVWIGTNSTIVGKITIGKNVLIAPNSFVNFDVPDNSLVIGNPAKIVAKEDATKGYVLFMQE